MEVGWARGCTRSTSSPDDLDGANEVLALNFQRSARGPVERLNQTDVAQPRAVHDRGGVHSTPASRRRVRRLRRILLSRDSASGSTRRAPGGRVRIRRGAPAGAARGRYMRKRPKPRPAACFAIIGADEATVIDLFGRARGERRAGSGQLQTRPARSWSAARPAPAAGSGTSGTRASRRCRSRSQALSTARSCSPPPTALPRIGKGSFQTGPATNVYSNVTVRPTATGTRSSVCSSSRS